MLPNLLTGEDIVHYPRTIVALKETARLIREIDAAIPSVQAGRAQA